MCDMQNMPTREDASCEEDPAMNFTAFSTVGTAGTHYVTTSQQLPKLQQNVSNNGSLSQMVGMVSGVSMSDGMQYVRALDGGGALQGTPQIISVPIALPGSKPGDPQQTVQIQVLTPNMLQPQQPKYQMQIPSFQQAGTVLTVAYSPDNNENGGIQLLQTNTADGQIQLVVPQEMQMVQPAQVQTAKQQPVEHQPFPQVIITQDQQIIINGSDIGKLNNNNNNISSGITSVVVKEECVEMDEDETSQDVDTTWDSNANQDLIKYLNTLPPQQTQALPVSLQQFLRLNPVDKKPVIQPETVVIQMDEMDDKKEAELGEDGSIRITKKKKKYKKKPPRPARPKPGQVIIATAEDGTPIFCCPECSMAYPEKEQLEMHLIVHKIERRYICGICGAGLKRKEHLERHKMGHNPERPYVCSVCNKGFKRREHLNLHTVIHSGVKTEMCTECGKGFYRKDHLRKHMRFHENKRARDEAANEPHDAKPANIATMSTSTNPTTLLPEITIHVPTSANMQVPVQINIPQHVVTSLAQAQAQALTQASDTQSQLDALLAQHS